MADFNTDGKSWGGTIATILLFKISQATKSDFMFVIGAGSGLLTMGYTCYKWYLLYRGNKVPKKLE